MNCDWNAGSREVPGVRECGTEGVVIFVDKNLTISYIIINVDDRVLVSRGKSILQ